MLYGSSRMLFITMQETLSKRRSNMKGVKDKEQLTHLREL